MSTNKKYWVYDLYLRLTKSTPATKEDIQEIKKSIGDEVLKTPIRELDINEDEKIDMSFYFDDNYENKKK